MTYRGKILAVDFYKKAPYLVHLLDLDDYTHARGDDLEEDRGAR